MITGVVIVRDGRLHLRKNIDLDWKHCTIPIVLEYLAEGGANVVLRLVPFAKAAKIPCPPELRGRLLRVRKDKPFIAPTQQQHRCFREMFAPLFDQKDLVDSILVTIDNEILLAINHELRGLENDGIRSIRRKGDTVATSETNAILLKDMTPFGAEVCLEIKPKWLVQSPDAPSGSKRCRTCALRARRTRTGRVDPEVASAEGYCPLAILSDDEEARLQAATAIMKANKTHWMSNREQTFLNILPHYIRPLLQKLRDLQLEFDERGILSLSEDSEPSAYYLKAMTLRDCTMFIKAPESFNAGPIDVRLADLDFKFAHPDKIKKWRRTEANLIEEGWYTNTEADGTKEEICLLAKDATS